jgi:hypothetical protein
MFGLLGEDLIQEEGKPIRTEHRQEPRGGSKTHVLHDHGKAVMAFYLDISWLEFSLKLMEYVLFIVV